MTDKALISETYKQLIQLIRKKKNPSKKLAEDMNKHFSKKDIQLVNRYMRRCSRSLIIREMQMKTTMRYYFTRVRMAVIKKPTNNKCWPGCEEKRTLVHCWWECRLVQPLLKKVQWFLKKLTRELLYDPAIPLLGIYLKKPKHLFKKIHAPQCSQQHYLQLPRYGSNLSVH